VSDQVVAECDSVPCQPVLDDRSVLTPDSRVVERDRDETLQSVIGDVEGLGNTESGTVGTGTYVDGRGGEHEPNSLTRRFEQPPDDSSRTAVERLDVVGDQGECEARRSGELLDDPDALAHQTFGRERRPLVRGSPGSLENLLVAVVVAEWEQQGSAEDLACEQVGTEAGHRVDELWPVLGSFVGREVLDRGAEPVDPGGHDAVSAPIAFTKIDPAGGDEADLCSWIDRGRSVGVGSSDRSGVYGADQSAEQRRASGPRRSGHDHRSTDLEGVECARLTGPGHDVGQLLAKTFGPSVSERTEVAQRLFDLVEVEARQIRAHHHRLAPERLRERGEP